MMSHHLSDVDHFKAVIRDEQMLRIIRSYGLDTHIYKHGQNRNDGLKLWKRTWRIACPAPGNVDGIEIHFEARHPGEIQVDVEIFPYEGSIAKKPGRETELERPLRLKACLLSAIRQRLLSDGRCKNIGVTRGRFGDPSRTSTLGAAKFVQSTNATYSPQEDAAFMTRVIECVTPLIDASIETHR